MSVDRAEADIAATSVLVRDRTHENVHGPTCLAEIVSALPPLNVPAVDLAHAYFGSSRHADVQFRFINVNLVEATNRRSHFQVIATSAFVFL
jgi:hypothetical protein